MNYKHIAIIACIFLIALAVAPVTAVWANGNWIMDKEAPPAVYDSVTDVSSKYVPTGDLAVTDGCGALYVQLAAHHNLITKGFEIRRVLNSDEFAFVSGQKIAADTVPSIKVTDPTSFQFGLSGNFDDRFAPGVYLLSIADGNGGQPEYAVVRVIENYRSDVTFYGHAVSADSRPDPLDASFEGYFGCGDIDVKNIRFVKTGEHWVSPYMTTECKWITVVDQVDTPAYDEFVPAVTHIVHHDAVYSPTNDANHVHAKKIHGNSLHDFVYNGDKYQITGNSYDTKFKKISDAYDETIVDVPAKARVCEQVQHPGYWQDEYGFEIFIEIDGARLAVTNPNVVAVKVDYSFDVNYAVDRHSHDGNAEDDQIEWRHKTYTGTKLTVGTGITSFYVSLTPDIDNAVEVLDTDGLNYAPYINNEQVTATVWA